jgi:amino acid transporter
VFWLFFFLTGTALFVLRYAEPYVPRPFRVPGYPVTPLVFCGWCGYMVGGVIAFSPWRSLIGLTIVAAGIPLYWLSNRLVRPWRSAPAPVIPFSGRADDRPLAGLFQRGERGLGAP